jgi:hypothetical protein
VNTEEVTTPLELVVSVSVAVPLANVPLAPVAGAVKVTLTPLVGVPFVVTVAESVPNGLPAGWGVVYPPLFAVIVTTLAGGVLELLLLQLVRKVKVEKIKVEITNAGMLQ